MDLDPLGALNLLNLRNTQGQAGEVPSHLCCVQCLRSQDSTSIFQDDFFVSFVLVFLFILG